MSSSRDYPSGSRVFIKLEAWAGLQAHARSAPNREIGGVLVGDLFEDTALKGRHYLDISAYLPAGRAEERLSSITFTHATWNRLHREVNQRHGGKHIAGWFHSHPGFGVFLSADDSFIHRNFFNLPWQIALVVDPLNKLHRLFSIFESKFYSTDTIYVYVEQPGKDDAARLASVLYSRSDRAAAVGLMEKSRLLRSGRQDLRIAVALKSPGGGRRREGPR